MNDAEIEIVRQEFKEKAENFLILYEYQEKFVDLFLKVKLGLVTFVGIIFTIVFSESEKFSANFLIILAILTSLIFLLFIIELRQKLWDLFKAIKKQYERTALAKIRHIAALENLPDWGKRAQEILIGEDNIRQAIYNKESITDITQYKKSVFWKIYFYFWAILMLSIPLLFLLAFLKII